MNSAIRKSFGKEVKYLFRSDYLGARPNNSKLDSKCLFCHHHIIITYYLSFSMLFPFSRFGRAEFNFYAFLNNNLWMDLSRN